MQLPVILLTLDICLSLGGGVLSVTPLQLADSACSRVTHRKTLSVTATAYPLQVTFRYCYM